MCNLSAIQLTVCVCVCRLLCGHVQPCREFLSESDVRFMYNEMMIRSEQIYFGYSSLYLHV